MRSRPPFPLLVALLAAAALGTAGASTCSAPGGPKPDANDDGVVDILDASLVATCEGADPSSGGPCASGDVDGDGDVDGGDLDAVAEHFGNRVRVAGELFELVFPEGPVSQPGVGTLLGRFELASNGADDLLEGPTAASLAAGGDLGAEVLRVNGPRRVDPTSGRPLRKDAPDGAECETGAEPACLFDPTAPVGAQPEPPQSRAAFEAFCDLTRGFTPLDPTSCAVDIFNSQAITGGLLPVASALSSVVSGDPALAPLVLNGLIDTLSGNVVPGGPIPGNDLDTAAVAAERVFPSAGPPGSTPTVPLNQDPADGGGDSLSSRLASEQEALLGCGPFYGTSCDGDGIRLLQAEASALAAAFPLRPDGTIAQGVDTTDASLRQPGTSGLHPSPVCTRFVDGELVLLPGCGGPTATVAVAGEPLGARPCLRQVGEELVRLPGCRGPGDPGYGPHLDGSVLLAGEDGVLGTADDDRHPFTGEAFRSELAVASWNLLMLFVASSTVPPAEADAADFDPTRPMRDDGCSFARPGLCTAVTAFLGTTVRSLGEEPPRLRFAWETGADYAVGSADGALAPFSDWTLHALGPTRSRLPSLGALAVRVLLSAPEAATAPPSSPLVQRGPGPDGLVGTADDSFVGFAFGGAPDPAN